MKNRVYSILIMIVVLYFILGNIVTCVSKKRIGAECCDETLSSATGSGACSHHGGVRQWRYEYWYSDIDEPYNSIFKHTIGGSRSENNCTY